MSRMIPILLLLCCSFTLRGQEGDYVPEGKAAEVVSAFYRTLNLEALRTDSLLFVESRVVIRGDTDTLIMRRWCGPRHRRRLEMWHNGGLQMCLFSDGHTYFERYKVSDGWKSINAEDYFDEAQVYEVYGPLYQWYLQGDELTYEGTVQFRDNRVECVTARSASHYDRRYYFERDSKLLFLYTESDSINGEPTPIPPRNRVDWHAYHEYRPLGLALLPSAESYQHDNSITLIFHQARYVAYDERIFTQRQKP